MSADSHYRRDGEDAILRCVLDDIVLLYHRPSGQTHMVISPVPEILDMMADGEPASAQTIHDALAQRYDLGAPDDAVAEIGVHLAHLDALGLVRPA